MTGFGHGDQPQSPVRCNYSTFWPTYSRAQVPPSEVIVTGGEMGTENKGRHKAEQAAGAMKRKAGEAIGDEELQAKGRADEKGSRGKQAVDGAAQRARDAKEGIGDRAREAFDRNR